MRVTLDFTWFNPPGDDIPKNRIFTDKNFRVPQIGSQLTFEFADGSGEIQFNVEGVDYTYKESDEKITGITIFLKML